MKKIFKGLAIAVAATATCAGIALAATGCSAGKNGTYYGEYHYENYGHTYGMIVEVKVQNNIITQIPDITNTDNSHAKEIQKDTAWVVVSDANPSYGWTDDDVKKWNTYENWLLQQYVGWSVADIIDISVYYDGVGQPYEVKGGYNAELSQSGLLITNATQGSGRLMLAVQNALK